MKVTIGVVAALFVLSAGSAMAGEACCGRARARPKACSAAAVSNLVTKLSLTDEQAAKVQAICAKYSQAESPAAGAKACMAAVEKVLTPEQSAKFKEMCRAQGCPVKKAE